MFEEGAWILAFVADDWKPGPSGAWVWARREAPDAGWLSGGFWMRVSASGLQEDALKSEWIGGGVCLRADSIARAALSETVSEMASGRIDLGSALVHGVACLSGGAPDFLALGGPLVEAGWLGGNWRGPDFWREARRFGICALERFAIEAGLPCGRAREREGAL